LFLFVIMNDAGRWWGKY